MRRSVTLVLCGLLILGAREGTARDRAASIDRAIELYEDLEYRASAELLKKVLRSKTLSTTARSRGYRYLGLCHVVLGEPRQARVAFEKLLLVKPGFRLSNTVNPKALDLFDQVRESFLRARARRAPLPKILVTPSPVPAKQDAPIEVTVALPEKLNSHKIVVYYRTRGKKLYSSIVAKTEDGRGHVATIPGAFVLAPAIEYYAIVVSGSGKIVAREGSKEEPLSIAVRELGNATAAPLYKKWWLWASIGAVTIGGAFGYWQLSQGSNDAIVDINIVIDE